MGKTNPEKRSIVMTDSRHVVGYGLKTTGQVLKVPKDIPSRLADQLVYQGFADDVVVESSNSKKAKDKDSDNPG